MNNMAIVLGFPGHASLERLVPTTKVVHIVQHPTLWLIKKIIEQCPDIRSVQIAPASQRKFPAQARELLERHGIKLSVKCLGPGDVKPHGKKFFARQRFLNTLSGSALKRLNTLLKIDHPGAKALLHYYGARGYEERSNLSMYREFGQSHPCHLNDNRDGVLYFLDPAWTVGKRAREIARVLPKKIRLAQARVKQAAPGTNRSG